MKRYQLRDGDELDQIVYQQYGELPGALEAVLRANWAQLHLWNNLGRVFPLNNPEFIILPELKRPTELTKTARIFD